MYSNRAMRCVGVTSVMRPKSSTQILPSSVVQEWEQDGVQDGGSVPQA
jgi:hypothetical protein